MAPMFRRFACSASVWILAAAPLAFWTSQTFGEERKFVVLLADPPKDHRGSSLNLPKRSTVYDAYFDKNKNGQNGAPRVDSHAEWWEEVSYGDVTVSGNVFGWISVPWPTFPPGSAERISHVDLQGNQSYEPGFGESFNPFLAKFKYDLDGAGENTRYGNFNADAWLGFAGAGLGLGDTDPRGNFIYAPGERFLDLNGNRIYDAGVFEWGIDKNGNGKIDVDPPGAPRKYNAGSWNELVSANFTYPQEQDQPPTFNSWSNQTEWFDANGDGRWNKDGLQFVRGFVFLNGQTVTLFRGDWGGSEIWVDRNGDGVVGSPATPLGQNQGERPATFFEFLAEVNKPDETSVEYFDEQFNKAYDFPEPFEDFLRRWDPQAHDFVITSQQYIRNNYPGDANKVIARIGNHRYDGPDSWSNWRDSSSNKLQNILGYLDDAAESAEQFERSSRTTPEPTWLGEFWQERYGSEPPTWDETIPYLHKFNPQTPIPRLQGGQDLTMKFEPNGGGPYNSGLKADGSRYGAGDGTVMPDIANREDGWYDGQAEYDDLPSSIYHKEGDQNFGEVTSPSSDNTWGEDIGAPGGGAFPDQIVDAGGPLAYNVHGDGGFDGGNVMNTEFMTWRTDGRSSADREIDFDGDGIPDFFWYHRDVNLDGLLDLGETTGDAGQYGIPEVPNNYSNYGVDPYPGTRPDGGPWSIYPWNRERLMEDMVAALDEAVDWDDFLGGPGQFGNVISGVILLPSGTAAGKFFLPAPSLNYGIRTRDRINPNATGRERYVPLNFFNGLGISLDDDNGEGGAFNVGSFHTPFSAHEYGHSWEGYPDLYDYDVYREDFDGRIINNPIGAWCVMAGGGLVHPVPILKAELSGWIKPVDITTALIPSSSSSILFRAWEFDRNRTVYVYSNPLFSGETYWLWRNSPGTQGRLSFDRFQPGFGLLIMHVDDRGNTEGLPTQQRLESHFVYQLVQADGLHDLESGKDFGDAGDPFPGTSNVRVWNRNTDPNNRWYSGQSSGLDITNIQPQGNDTLVTFKWSPKELPTLEWVQPPGGISVNGIYQLKFFAYDQFGGTRIELYAFRNEPSAPSPNTGGSWLNAIQMGSTTKAPGDVDGGFGANVSVLNDGTYTFFAKLVPGRGNDNNVEHSFSIPRANINNVGTGQLIVNNVDLAVSKYERWSVTVVSDQPPGTETWEVVGSLSGKQKVRATTGAPYVTDAELASDNASHNAVAFQIIPGNVPFRVGDQFNFLTTGLTPHSAAVLIKDGEVVQPEPPVAVAKVENGVTSGLAPLQVVFKHNQSSDPKGAALTFAWDFGDGSNPVTTTNPDQPIVHVYTAPRQQPYLATLTVTNSFNLSDTDTIQIAVNEASPPVVRAVADPVTGIRPLRVKFNGDLTTDPNPGTQGIDYVWDFGDGSAVETTINVEHTYANAGVYRATLTATNRPYGKSASQVLEIRVSGPPADQPPVATFSVDRLSGDAPLKVAFNANSSFDPESGLLQYAWNFGDGSAIVRGVSTTEHTFTKARTYNVTLTVTDPSGQTDTAALAIVVTGGTVNQSPVARIVASATQGPAPFTVTFDAQNSSDPEGGNLSYAWDFGDGSAQVTGATVTHTFTEARQYSVVLVVSDAKGATGASTITVSVTLPEGNSGLGVPDNGGTGTPATNIGCGSFGLFQMTLMLLGLGGVRRVFTGGRRRR